MGISGLLIFRVVAEPRNSGKSAESREIHKNTKNTAKFLSNTCLYNIFGTYFSYRGYLLAVNLKIYLRTSSLERANNVPKLPGVDYVAKNWALAMMLKALPLVHFWSVLLKEQMMTSVRKTLKILVWSAQNWSISSEICHENNHKIGPFLPIAFWWGLLRKLPRNRPIFPRICLQKSREIWLFLPRPIRSPGYLLEVSLQILLPPLPVIILWNGFFKKKTKNKNKIRGFRELFCYGHTKILGL